MKLALERLPYLAERAKDKLANQLRTMASVHSTHKHVLLQLSEAACLRLSSRRVGMGEYIGQAMYDRRLYPHGRLSSFGGWWFKERIHARLNNLRWEGMVTDKLMLYALFRQFGLPHPAVRAAAWGRARACGEVPVFDTPDALALFLREEAGSLYPLFCKPVKGCYGQGAALIEDHEKEGNLLRFSDGTRRHDLDFLQALEDDGWGYLLQDAVRPAPETRPVCGDRVSGLRVIMLLDDDGAFPFRAAWKIPTGGNVTDTFRAGALGNMAGAVDVDSGRVLRTVSAHGVGFRLNQPHPDTGCRVTGMKVPGWEDVVDLLRRAAECFPGFRWQHWDVGLGANGPVLFELNSAGNTDLIQIAYGEGILTEELKAFLARHGDKTEPEHGRVFGEPDGMEDR